MSDSAAILDRLKQLHPRSIDLSLGRIERLLGRLDHPERRLSPVVHVAGTNGKGSVIAFLKAMLEASGLRVHVYTSPHLVRFSERIVLAGKEISEEQLAESLEICEQANAGDAITFFEITTAAAFWAFARTPADVTLLETGLGGRLDATNVIDRPALTVLTPISVDHQSFLGETLAEIAGEKAGILKPGVTCVVSRQEHVAAATIRRLAKDLGAPLYRQDKHWRCTRDGDGLRFVDLERDDAFDLPFPALIGDHQYVNAGLAIAATRKSPHLSVPAQAMASGLKTVRWPARLQHLLRGHLVSLLPPGCSLWVDGGHNVAAAEVLAREIAKWESPVHLIIGMMSGKDTSGFLSRLCPYAASTTTVPILGEPAAVPAAELAARANGLGYRATSADSIEQAVGNLRPLGSGGAQILMCGSLYLAGKALASNGA